MKKLLLVSTAIAGAVLLSAPASAAVKLDLGGHFRGYAVFADNDETTTNSVRDFDLRRDAEVHVSGETTLDNGLTVGFHTEQQLGGATTTDEAYAYFSSGMGRINLGAEDGAAYLLQVGAPSADSNVDGLRTYIQALDLFTLTGAAGADGTIGFFGADLGRFGLSATNVLDYDHVSDPTDAHSTDRITYLTPKYMGFQAGVSYAPEVGTNAVGNNLAVLNQDDDAADYEDIWEAAVRWDGEYQGFGLSAGVGYSHSSLESGQTALATAFTAVVGNKDLAPILSEDLSKWNGGVAVSWNGFSLGGTYSREESGMKDVREVTDASAVFAASTADTQRDIWAVGAAWDNGPWHVGASYLDSSVERDATGVAGDDGELAAVQADIDRFTVGAGYTFGPGMTFRGSVSWGEYDRNAVAEDATDGAGEDNVTDAAVNRDFQLIAVGTDIQF